MKNVVYIISFLSVFMSCKAQQQILPLETKGWPVEGTYYKDLDNELDSYIEHIKEYLIIKLL